VVGKKRKGKAIPPAMEQAPAFRIVHSVSSRSMSFEIGKL
jgi:hypothetical protein